MTPAEGGMGRDEEIERALALNSLNPSLPINRIKKEKLETG